jgi:hypothetical protein
LWVADDDGIDVGGIGRAQDGSHVAGLLDTLKDDYERTLLQLQTVERSLLGNDLGNDAFSTTTIGYLVIYIGRYLEHTGTIDSRFFSTEDLRAPKERINLIAALDATLYLSPTLHDKQTALAALL